jgi:hypothetical protein
MGTLQRGVPLNNLLVFREMPAGSFLSENISETVFSLIRHTETVEKIFLMRLNMSIFEYVDQILGLRVEQLVVTECPHIDAVRVSWLKVVADDIDQYEFLFDQPDFIPA